jgi:hypothetical protein
MLSNPHSSSWQEKPCSSFGAIKYILFAMLAVGAALAFFIILHLRIAWAVILSSVGGEFAEHDVDFDAPVYNVWRQREKTGARASPAADPWWIDQRRGAINGAGGLSRDT